MSRTAAEEREIQEIEGNIRILIVEDNSTNQKVTLAILDKLGCYADAVKDGKEALRALEAESYDLILMDVQMPGMDGFETTKNIRDDKSGVQNHDIPIIAMTAHAMQGDREKCLAAGMDDYIAKPMQLNDLREVIERTLANEAGKPAHVSSKTRASDIFDSKALYEVLNGDEATIKSIIDNFIEETRNQIDKLRDAHKSRDSTQASRIAHSLKSASGIIGANLMQNTAFQLEEKVNAGSLEKTEGLINLFEERFREFEIFISKGTLKN